MRNTALLTLAIIVLMIPLVGPCHAAAAETVRPNILWLIAEDMGPEALTCSGTPEVWTPNLDRLAAEGVRYTRAYNGLVCSPSRSAFMTGMYATTIGAHNHRSHRDDGYRLPDGVRVLTDWMRDAGYFTANVVQLPAECGFRGTGKTDWNFLYEGKPFDSDRWDDLKTHQPFYAQVNFRETHRAFRAPPRADPAKVVIPPYYPDDPVTRKDWAAYLDAASELDHKIGLVLKQLQADGLADNTVVVFFGDNGQAHVRGKQFCYEEGLHVPLIVRWPKGVGLPAGWTPGMQDARLLEGIDLAPTMLAIAGATKPAKMQGRIFLGDRAEPARQYAFGARDRCDETVMRIRTVRDACYRYIRNFTPQKPLLAPNAYKERAYPVWNLLKELHVQGKLTPAQDALCLATMPPEELYDLQADPHEIENLAGSSRPEHQAAMTRLRGVLEKWIEETGDQGRTFEPAAVAAAQGATKPSDKPQDGSQPAPPKPGQGGEVVPLIEPHGQADLERLDQRIYTAAEKLARYLRSLVHPWNEDPGLLLLTESRSGENHIRPNTGAVEGFCFLCRFGPYEESVVGVSRRQLLADTIVPMVRYLVATHVTGSRPTSDKRRWGDAWQSAHWAQSLGRGAWYVWGELPEDVRLGVRRVVAHEADRIAGGVPPHQIQLDTKAEENAWNSRILSVAVLLMPDDPRRAGWETAFQKWAMSSFLRPADEQSQTIVDGRTVAAQFTGANIYDDFTLENHNIVHPDYMTCFSLSLAAELDYALSGRRPPECLRYNVAGLYENLKWFTLPDGGFVYPNGQDWQLFRNSDWTAKNVLMAALPRDPDAWSLACRCVDTLEKMQARSDSGAVYAPGETFFASSQTDLAGALATSWLILKTADRIERAPRDRVGVRRLDSAKIILRRTGSAIHTFSWGARVMAQCVPCRLDRIVSPDSLNGIGQIAIARQRKPLAIRLRDVKVTSGQNGFVAELTVDHGEHVRAELRFASSEDGTFTMREKLVALADLTTTRIATGQIGILNNPGWVYERGQRSVAIDGRAEEVPALSGKTVDAEKAREIVIDGVLRIRGAQPLCVRYVGALRPSRARATDLLYLNYVDKERTWRAGQTISEYEAVVSVEPGP